MVYDLTFLDNSTGLMDIITGVDSMTNGGLFTGIIFIASILFIMLGVQSGYSMKKVILANGFITTILAVLLWGSGLASFLVVTWGIIMIFAGIMLVVFGGGD